MWCLVASGFLQLEQSYLVGPFKKQDPEIFQKVDEAEKDWDVIFNWHRIITPEDDTVIDSSTKGWYVVSWSTTWKSSLCSSEAYIHKDAQVIGPFATEKEAESSEYHKEDRRLVLQIRPMA